jgi:hypothetical protein
LRESVGGVESLEGANLPLDWDLGFRVGAGHVFSCDCWNFRAYWTHFRSQGKKSLTRPRELIETQFFGGFINRDIADSARVGLKFDYNMFDAQLGREFCFGDCFSLRPFTGVKGGWIDQKISTAWNNLVLIPFSLYSSTEDLTNDFWGVGPVAGVGSKWGKNLFLFGDFEGAILWGTWENTDRYANSRGEVINTNTKNTQLASLSLHAFLGIGWEANFGCARLAARLGYESQIWFCQFRIATFQQLRVHGDLTIQGGTARVSLEF